MFWFPSPTACTLALLFGIGKTICEEIGRNMPRTQKPLNLNYESPFIELDVKPVSDGDHVGIARHSDGKYTVSVDNRKKMAKLDLEADSKEELEAMVRDTFRAWAITGKKEPGKGVRYFL